MRLSYVDKTKMAASQASEHLSESLEDYLEAILEIEGEKHAARPKDIARKLLVSPPSVTAALRNLGARGLVNYAPYDLVTLTPSGRCLAEDVRRRHDVLRRFFEDFLRLDSGEADNLACHIEHQLPPHALQRLVKLMDFIESSTETGVTGLSQTGLAPRVLDPDEAGAGCERPSDGSTNDIA